MRSYGAVSPLFWTGKTGRSLRKDRDAQVVALYLMTAPTSHQSGVYYLPVSHIANDTGMTIQGATKALTRLIGGAFCRYDEAVEWIWVVEMAFWQIGTPTSPDDKRIKGMQNSYADFPKLSFLQDFYEKYQAAFRLEKRVHIIRGSEGASKPHASQDQDRIKTGVGGASPSTAPNGSAKPRNGKAVLPEDFLLTDAMRQQALKRFPDCDPERMFEQFRAHHEAHGKAMKSWPAAWITWIGNGERFGYPKNGSAGSGVGPSLLS